MPPRRNAFRFGRSGAWLDHGAGWVRVAWVITGSFLSWNLYRRPRRYLKRCLPAWGRNFSMLYRGGIRLALIPPRVGRWLWLRLEGGLDAADRLLSLGSEKLDDGIWAVRSGLARMWLRAAGPLVRGRRAAGRAVDLPRWHRDLLARWRRSRMSSWPPLSLLLGVTVVLALVLVSYDLGWGKDAVAVTVGGKVVAEAAGPDEVWAALAQLGRAQARACGRAVEPLEQVGLIPVHADSPLESVSELCAALSRYVRFGVPAAGIAVNGKVELVLADTAAAGQVLRDYAGVFAGDGARVRFEENVKVVPVTVPPGRILSEQAALAILSSSVTRPATYTVRAGDTLWELAERFHTGLAALLADNPGMNEKYLAVGEVVDLERPSRLINVLATYRIACDQDIPYRVEWQKDPGLYYGETVVVRAGRPGRERVVADVTEENGIQVNSRVVAEQVLQPPVPQLVRTGGDVEIASRGGDYHAGRFIWPAEGVITSPFGWRWIFGRREFHEGIDIGACYDAPVVAAAPGVVTLAGWYDGYGRCVMVNDGSGVTTLYAHLARILVSVGENVSQGQELGCVGESGEATGPHLHFGVEVNGSFVNPMDFL